MLDDRRSIILQALVEEYIRTGQPVSSRAVLEHCVVDVSSATVRNDLAKLESYGFVTQPHTSAGRVPTSAGYRYYVDHCSPTKLRNATRDRIESFFTGFHQELSKLLQQTSGLLTEITQYPAVVIGPGFGDEIVQGLHLVHLGGPVVMAVSVGATGRVGQEVVRLRFSPTDNELAEAEAVLAAAFEGSTLTEGGNKVNALVNEQDSDRVMKIALSVAATAGSTVDATRELYVGGTSHLASLWEDLAQVHTMLELLEQHSHVRRLLGDDQEGTSVRLGSETEVAGADFAVVSTAFSAGGGARGRVGVLGPMRMDYRRAIRIVEEVGDGLEDSLGA
ncbi:MAG: heat-inducible transcriptional repressor HrcA [Acidimicrobiia bacterium]|nr:heat-inducible transcriptional repressor HrcA [Acidimicrobiia bacterium]MDX2467497.1 heat-inducible transcriptional repressor HrcA [Acidimicrobiia bacterium]